MTLSKAETDALERTIDVHGIGYVLSALSYICGEKSTHIATNWQDTSLAKRWMDLSVTFDKLVGKTEAM